ncbi:hypothetical protein Salat_1561000 [Sesamum alatum]|uniref:Uncharacterized protein n=1 Tax=Sesamum alatum TaxID=300844 RepID=A0AAE1YD44_9LAMI|nr:hypothetical protein Salat_1561000 [Sesamum alatum]
MLLSHESPLPLYGLVGFLATFYRDLRRNFRFLRIQFSLMDSGFSRVQAALSLTESEDDGVLIASREATPFGPWLRATNLPTGRNRTLSGSRQTPTPHFSSPSHPSSARASAPSQSHHTPRGASIFGSFPAPVLTTSHSPAHNCPHTPTDIPTPPPDHDIPPDHPTPLIELPSHPIPPPAPTLITPLPQPPILAIPPPPLRCISPRTSLWSHTILLYSPCCSETDTHSSPPPPEN